ncbi:MAG: glutamine--fructose-6-phosphate aminotransferase [Elusimicrobia bacterium RIFCSPLOWO2_01_FULL_64_13]|nr:MAG: glutamine--fructose-6-phosphate aminotransferase [Elusimicrobia bacterium RIFCSPHIGHO2_01_FULL_64_10]OGR96688.1 MAG: glutamine--fructose-6-phosphate aminotransferase [Elusimicrobia bacterium RIFCSPLOWO2_01_FULL_64_13]
MCGIVGYVGKSPAGRILMDGLKRLEYRGYDSSGLAIIKDGSIQLRRSVGKIRRLEAILDKRPVLGTIGLGHTRWATHGIPSEENAHPHTDCSKRIVVVHNGIIENYARLKAGLIKKRHRFASQTDTEVIAHLIEEEARSLRGSGPAGRPGGGDLFFESVRRALLKLEGAYALGVISSDFPDVLIAARKDCPLVLGLGDGENFIASDVPALIPYTRRTIFLDQNEMARVTRDGISCRNLAGEPVEKSVTTVTWDPVQAEKSGHKHFMLKEILEQPSAIEDTMRGRVFPGERGLELGISLKPAFIRGLKKITLVACGTSYHAALVARFWFESLAKLPCQAEIASEFRYREPFLGRNDLAVFITQSGETADTIAALRLAGKCGAKALAVCNVLGSTITSAADAVFYTHCGPEIGVASTKAFTGQLTALLLLAVAFGSERGALGRKASSRILTDMIKLPGWVRQALGLSKRIEAAAGALAKKDHFLYLGRHLNYPLALEGALKLKEISYIHAEGYPAGEMKHGPIALIDGNMPIVALATRSSVYEKVCSNIQEAKARGGNVIAVASRGDSRIKEIADQAIFVPDVPEIFAPIVNAVPLQFLAYHIAVLRGCDVDQPRNLAKSVTVE